MPMRQIAENSGVEGSIVVNKILENKSETYGFDAQNEEYVDMLDKGIVDPAKVVRAALQDAASVAGLLVTTEAMVAEMPKEQPAMPAMPARRRHGRHGRDGFLIRPPIVETKGAVQTAPFVFWTVPGLARRRAAHSGHARLRRHRRAVRAAWSAHHRISAWLAFLGRRSLRGGHDTIAHDSSLAEGVAIS